MPDPSPQPSSQPQGDTQLKPGTSAPPKWLLRTLSITALSFTIFGLELIISGILQGATLPFGESAVPTYIPGGIFLVLGVRNLWSWKQMKEAIARSGQ